MSLSIPHRFSQKVIVRPLGITFGVIPPVIALEMIYFKIYFARPVESRLSERSSRKLKLIMYGANWGRRCRYWFYFYWFLFWWREKSLGLCGEHEKKNTSKMQISIRHSFWILEEIPWGDLSRSSFQNSSMDSFSNSYCKFSEL